MQYNTKWCKTDHAGTGTVRHGPRRTVWRKTFNCKCKMGQCVSNESQESECLTGGQAQSWANLCQKKHMNYRVWLAVAWQSLWERSPQSTLHCEHAPRMANGKEGKRQRHASWLKIASKAKNSLRKPKWLWRKTPWTNPSGVRAHGCPVASAGWPWDRPASSGLQRKR